MAYSFAVTIVVVVAMAALVWLEFEVEAVLAVVLEAVVVEEHRKF